MKQKKDSTGTKTNPVKKNKSTSGGQKDINEGGQPANDIKHGKGNTTGSHGTQ